MAVVMLSPEMLWGMGGSPPHAQAPDGDGGEWGWKSSGEVSLSLLSALCSLLSPL